MIAISWESAGYIALGIAVLMVSSFGLLAYLVRHKREK